MIGLLCLAAFVIRAERLPVKQYTVADGLAQGTVWRMHQDARGFLWLATSDGLSHIKLVPQQTKHSCDPATINWIT